MNKKRQLTKKAKSVLMDKKKELEKKLKRIEKNKDADILTAQTLRTNLREVDDIIGDSEVVEISESQPATVVLGATVSLESLSNSDTRDYEIMTRTTCNPLKGVLSCESPLAQKMMGLKLGNTFKFRDFAGTDETYKIKKIDY